jgi:ABC-type multidrug transport system permease subunit
VRIVLLGRHILHADYGINKENMVYKRKFPITGIAVSVIGGAAMLMLMFVETFKTDIILLWYCHMCS